MLFDDINIKTIEHDGELYIHVRELLNHLAAATYGFSDESYQIAQQHGITIDEKNFIMGIIHGMWSTVILLQQGRQEFQVESIETVDDIIKRFWDEDTTNK